MVAGLNSSTLLRFAWLVAIATALFVEPRASPPLYQHQVDNVATNRSESGGVRADRGGSCCPSGWMTYLDSCYLYVRERRQFQQAEHYCYQRQSTLFVANTLDEWDAVRIHSTRSYWTWIGLRVVSTLEPIRPIWETSNGMNPEILPWLNKQSTHGWVGGSDCAAYFHPPSTSGNYIVYNPCSHQNYFICELNATEISQAGKLKNPPVDPTWWWT